MRPMVSSTFMLSEPRCGVTLPAMFWAAMRPCSTATGWIASMSGLPVDRSTPSQQSPAA